MAACTTTARAVQELHGRFFFDAKPGGLQTQRSLETPLVQAVARFVIALAPAMLKRYAEKRMKTLNPFNAPGSPQAERQRARRGRFKIVVWTIVAANLVLFAGMLIQGCQREPATTETRDGNPVETASSDTSGTAAAQPMSGTNAPVTPPFESPAANPAVAAAVPHAAPEQAQPGARQYVVVKRDSFYKIAKAHRVSMKALADANPGVDSAKLKVGQVLQVPASAEPAAATPAASPVRASTKASLSTGRYVVKRGDTLDRIARAHRTTVRAIKAANGLTSERIVVGRSLKMPGTKAHGASSGTKAGPVTKSA